jgi:hypothetical protein
MKQQQNMALIGSRRLSGSKPREPHMRVGRFFAGNWCLRVGVALLVALSACAEDDKVSTNYMLVNHTDGGIVEVTVNRRGGVLEAAPLGESGRACCVTIPKHWRPELRVTIGWDDDSTEQLDAAGKPVLRDGKPVLIPGQRYTRTVPIQEYKRESLGEMYIHIFPDKSVVVTVSFITPSHPDYLPKNPSQRPRKL